LTFTHPLGGLSAEISFFPRGEQRSVSIAAASIVAKVTRDHLMTRHQFYFPWCSLADHKGYGTERHYQEIAQHNLALPSGRDTVSLIHRTTFLSKRHEVEDRDAVQTSLL
jgi:ribonuclease HII